MSSASPPLAGRCVVVTRPRDQAVALADAIRELGGEALVAPVLEIRPLSDTRELAQACEALDTFDIAFFVSPNAVRHALDFIQGRRSWPARLRVATVGKGSAAALHEAGFADVIAPASGFDSEAVLALPEFSPTAVRGRRVVVFRGDGGRELFGRELSARGAEVDYVTAYRRACPDDDWQALIERARAGGIDAVVVTSSEGVANLLRLLGPAGCSAFASIPLFVPHPRIEAAARKAGFQRVEMTPPGDHGIVSALCAALA